jgi:hypothetical protein
MVVPELVSLVHHQFKPRQHFRHQPTVLLRLLDQMRAGGMDFRSQAGPWFTGRRALKRPGRGGEAAIPVVRRGYVSVMVDTAAEAEELAGLLNWCGAPELI